MRATLCHSCSLRALNMASAYDRLMGRSPGACQPPGWTIPRWCLSALCSATPQVQLQLYSMQQPLVLVLLRAQASCIGISASLCPLCVISSSIFTSPLKLNVLSKSWTACTTGQQTMAAHLDCTSNSRSRPTKSKISTFATCRGREGHFCNHPGGAGSWVVPGQCWLSSLGFHARMGRDTDAWLLCCAILAPLLNTQLHAQPLI